jgi:hypothetical protein
MPRIPFDKISQLVTEQLPNYVKENYDTFIDFLKAYYEWMELNGNAIHETSNVLAYRDIDKTLDEFVIHFQHEFMPSIPNNILANKRTLIKHIKEFYRAKGSEKSYRLLFRILFNEDIDLYYPKVDLMRLSDGKWSQDKVLRCTTFHDTFDFIAHPIVGSVSGATANVENVIQFQIGANVISELYLSEIKGNFQKGEKIVVTTPSQGTVQETLYTLVTGVTVTDPGLRYQPEDLVFITDSNGTDALAAVDKIYGEDVGRVQSSQNTFILNPGPSQSTIDPYIQLATKASDIADYYTLMSIRITDGPGKDEVKQIIAYDAVTKKATVDSDWITLPTIQSHYSIELGKIKSLKMKDFGISYLNPDADFTQTGNGLATGTPITGVLGVFPGRWVTTDSFVDDIKIIEDSFFWQDFSYVIKSQESLNLYKNIVKKLLHPAGTIRFGEVDIITKLNLDPDFRTLERHKFKFAPYEAFVQNYPSPNSGYWTPDGFGNTQNSIYANVRNSIVDEQPDLKRNHVADVFIGITVLPNSVPSNQEVAEYNCVQGFNPQVLYDVHVGVKIYNGELGSKPVVDENDPHYITEGLDFA